jgi:uncharacterized membrane protein
MHLLIRDLWYWRQRSLWFVPLVMVLLAIAAAWLLLSLDRLFGEGLTQKYPFLYGGDPQSARDVLSTVAGSMVTVAGVVFSISLVAISLASNQYGPRVLPGFMRDRGHQLVFGVFISTFLYCLLVLSQIRQSGANGRVPTLSVAFGILASAVSIGFLVYFIHHVHEEVQVDTLVERSSREMDGVIRQLYSEQEDANTPESLEMPEGDPVPATKSGYVQDYDEGRLLALARKHGVRIRIVAMPGGFIAKHTILARLDRQFDPHTAHKLARRIARCFAIGAQRTPIKDVIYSVNQLVQIALRALSPGINDPLSAELCIDRLAEALAKIAARPTPAQYRRDKTGQVRVFASHPTFSDVLWQSFEQILLFAQPNPAVIVKLLHSLARVAERTTRPADLAELHRFGTLAAQKQEGAGNEWKISEALEQLEMSLAEARERISAESHGG